MSEPNPLSTNLEPPKQSDSPEENTTKTRDAFTRFIEENPLGRFSEVTSEAEMFKLSRHVLDNWDLDAFDALKAKHLKEESGTPKHKLKYLDLFGWLGGRMNPAILMGLHKSMPLKILDIGTGPGHFACIARFFGHQILTSDIPEGTPEGSVMKGSIPDRKTNDTFYKEMIEYFKLDRVEYRVEPFKKAPAFEQKFDLISVLMPSFEKYSYDKKLWGLEEWGFLINDFKENLLTENGRMFFWLSRTPQFEGVQPNNPEFIEYMESLGAIADIGRSVVMFGEF